MGNEVVIEITNSAMKTALILSAPMLLGALFIGVLVSLFQAVIQINEQTLSFIPKILVIVGALVFFSPWMLDTMTEYTRETFLRIPEMVQSP